MSTGGASAEPRTETSPGSPGTGFYFRSEREPGGEEDGEAAFLQGAMPKRVQTSRHQAVRPGCSAPSAQEHALGPFRTPRARAGALREPSAATGGKAQQRVQAGHAGPQGAEWRAAAGGGTCKHKPTSALSQHTRLWQSLQPDLRLPTCPQPSCPASLSSQLCFASRPLPGGSC